MSPSTSLEPLDQEIQSVDQNHITRSETYHRQPGELRRSDRSSNSSVNFDDLPMEDISAMLGGKSIRDSLPIIPRTESELSSQRVPSSRPADLLVPRCVGSVKCPEEESDSVSEPYGYITIESVEKIDGEVVAVVSGRDDASSVLNSSENLILTEEESGPEEPVSDSDDDSDLSELFSFQRPPLPRPPSSLIRNRKSSFRRLGSKSSNRSAKETAISFGDISVRDYPMVLGDHPNCKFGPPVTLGWDYLEYQSISVDEYEANYSLRRKMPELYLDSIFRRRVVTDIGCSAPEQSQAISSVKHTRYLREQSSRDIIRGVTSYFDDEKGKRSLTSGLYAPISKTVDGMILMAQTMKTMAKRRVNKVKRVTSKLR